MKVYLITEAQMEQLRERLELERLRADNLLRKDDYAKIAENDTLYRAFNFVVCRWRDEISR